MEGLLGPDPHADESEEEGRHGEGDVEPKHGTGLEPDEKDSGQRSKENALECTREVHRGGANNSMHRAC